MANASTTAYYGTDALGSVTSLTGPAGTALASYTDGAYGATASSSVDPSVADNPFEFAGEYRDPVTGLYDLHARQYDSSTLAFDISAEQAHDKVKGLGEP